ncbi:hypothetical protein [Paenarthrobacter sp. NPDC090522]|uniref:hypothetical protein n=1 Tax=Paenarthrobacter sp. NPDC090522 TaxID=3364383 RepID=UPI003804E406
MASWRDSVSQAAQDDLDQLLNLALPFAEQCLTKYGEFFPFSIAIGVDGEPIFIATESSMEEHPQSNDVIAESYEALAAQRNSIRAAVVVSDVRLREQDSDAVYIATEHAEGLGLGLYQPYRLVPGGDVELGDMSLVAGERVIWPEG